MVLNSLAFENVVMINQKIHINCFFTMKVRNEALLIALASDFHSNLGYFLLMFYNFLITSIHFVFHVQIIIFCV